MLYASSRQLFGGIQHNTPSRFLSEIDNQFQSLNPDYSTMLGPPKQTLSEEVRVVPELAEGDTVRHQVFGTGTVMEIDGDAAVVYFKGRGARKLNLGFAPLEKL